MLLYGLTLELVYVEALVLPDDDEEPPLLVPLLTADPVHEQKASYFMHKIPSLQL